MITCEGLSTVLVSELLERLAEIPKVWEVRGTAKGSLEVWDPEGPQYGYVFPNGRPTLILTDRHWKERR